MAPKVGVLYAKGRVYHGVSGHTGRVVLGVSGFSGFSTVPPPSQNIVNQNPPPDGGTPAIPYFKCKFCRGKRLSKCAGEQLEGRPRICKYGTWFSLYKWFVRIFIIAIGTIGTGWAANIVFIKRVPATEYVGLCATIILALAGIGVGICLFSLIGKLQEEFWSAGGSIWGKER